MKPAAEDLINGEISSVGVYLYNKVKSHIFEKEPIEKTAARKADFEKIIEEKIELEEFPAISQEDIKAICKILYNSNNIELIIKQLYVFQSGINKSLDEIKEDFVSLFPKTIKLKNGKRNLEAEERSSFLLKVFEVLDEGIQIALNRAANEGSSGASNALSNRRHFDMKNELVNRLKDVKKLVSNGSQLQREQIPLLGKMFGVPSLPPNYLPRKDDLNIIKELILTDTVKPVVITSAKQVTALQGMGGMGKSVLPAAFARDAETRRTFYNGIFWITVGLESLESDAIGNMRLIGTNLGDDPVNYSSKKEAEASLSKVLSDKVCLIILDDVWKVPQVTPFFNTLGSRCRLLITTRNDDVVTSLGAQEHKIEVLSEPEALKLLANWCEQEIDSLPSEAVKVARECGYLPLALSICGAMAKSGISWTYILEALQEADLEFIEAQLPNYPDPNVGRALKVSVDFLSREDPDAVLRYQELAIFPEDELVPEDTIAILWKHTGNLKRRNVEKLLTKLKDRSLLRLDGKAPNRLISLHDLQYDYLRAKTGDLPSLHNNLLEAYGEECGNKWSLGPEDGYFYRRLAYHMKEAGKREELRKLLLNFEWMCSKLKKKCIIQNETGVRKPDVNSLLHDYDYLSDDPEIRLVQGAIKLSFNAIVKGKTQLAGQLLGRLLCFHESGIQSLLNQAIECKNGTRLLPKTSSLIPPGGQLVRVFEENEAIRDVTVTPDGKSVISASDDNTLKVWDLETGEERITLRGHNDSVRAVSVTPNGKYAVSASIDRTLRIWNLETGKEKTTIVGHKEGVNAVAVTPDGESVISASDDHTLKVWDIKTGEEKAILGKQFITWAVAVAPNGKYAYSASAFGEIIIWDIETGKEKAVLKGHDQGVIAIAITPNSKYAISASYDRTLKVWDLEKEESETTVREHNDTVWDVTVTPNGKYAISVSSDKTLKIWNLETGEEKTKIIGHAEGVNAVTVTPNGKYAISASCDQTLKVWDLETGKEKTTFRGHDDYVNAVAVTPNGKYAISASVDCTIKIWDFETGKEKATLTGHDAGVNAVAIAPDGKCVISASSDKTLKVWDLETGKEKATFRGHNGCVSAVAVTPNGKYAISASEDHTLIAWNLETGEEKAILRGHNDCVNGVAVTSNGDYAFSASLDRTLKVWDLKTWDNISCFTGDSSFQTCNVSPDGKTIVAGDDSGEVHFLHLDKPN